MMTWRKLGLHDKPILLVDIAGYWQSLLRLIDHVIAQGFAAPTDRELYKVVSASATAGDSLKVAYDKAMSALQPRYGNWAIFEHCMPFDVSRAYDEVKGMDHPRIWTAERDIEMWRALEGA